MISGLVLTISVVLTLIAFFIGGYLIYLTKKGDDPENKDKLWLFSNQYTSGHAEFVILEKEYSEKRVRLKLSPRDINLIKAQNNNYEIKDYPLFLDKKQFEPLVLSEHRNIYAGYPQRMEDLTEGFKNTRLGKGVINAINEGNISKHISEVYKKRIEASEEIGIEMSSSILYDLENQALKKALKDGSSMIKEEKRDEKR